MTRGLIAGKSEPHFKRSPIGRLALWGVIMCLLVGQFISLDPLQAACAVEAVVPRLYAIESLAEEQGALYDGEWKIQGSVNGSKGPWILEMKYGGSNAEGVRSTFSALPDDWEDAVLDWENTWSRETQWWTPFEGDLEKLEPGSLYGFRVVSENGEGKASNWIDQVVPEFTSSEYSVHTFDVTPMSVNDLLTGKVFEATVTYDSEGFTMNRTRHFLYVVVPPSGEKNSKAFETGIDTGILIFNDVDGGIEDDDFALDLSICLQKNKDEIEAGEYGIRVYTNQTYLGSYTFTVEPETPFPTLQKGSNGSAVETMQRALRTLEYLDGEADGSFGGKTEAAVKAAQKDFGMEENGVADDAFQRELFISAPWWF